MNISVNDEVNVEVVDDKIIITKAHPAKIDLEKLFSNYNGEYKGEEYDWGPSVGEEAW